MHGLVDLNALAWLEDYLQTWQGTLLVVCVRRPHYAIGITELSCPQISRSRIPVSVHVIHP